MVPALAATADVAVPAPTLSAPSPRELMLALAGPMALAGACALGASAADAGVALRALPAGGLVALGSLALTAPALFVAHQLLGLQSRPEDVVTVLARLAVDGGRLLFGLVPAVLLFALTSDLALGATAATVAGASTLLSLRAVRELTLVERATGSGIEPGLRMTVLGLAWAGLLQLVGLRLAWSALTFSLGFNPL